MIKKDSANGFFDDGLFYIFPSNKQPRHVKFMVSTGSPEVESCDFRLTTLQRPETPITAGELNTTNNSTLELPPSGPTGYEHAPF